MAEQTAGGATGAASSGTVGVARDALIASMPFRDDSPASGASAATSEGKPETARPEAAPVDTEVDEATPGDGAPDGATDDASVSADADDNTAVEPDGDAAAKSKVDPDTQKRLDMVTAAEKRAKQKLAMERSEFDEQRKTFLDEQKAHRASVDRFEAAKKRAKYDAVSVLRELGLSEDDYESAAQQLYALSPAGKADPKRRASVEAAMRDREKADKVSELEAKLQRLENEKQQERAAAEARAAQDEYLATLQQQAVPESAPLVAKHLAGAPAKAKAGLWAKAQELFKATGEPPEPAEVIAAYEKQRREELAELGIDVAAIVSGKPAPAETKKPSKTLGQGLNSATPPAQKPAKRSREDLDQEILRELGKPDFRLE